MLFRSGVTENRILLEAPGESLATLMRDRGYATLAMGSNMGLNIPGFERKRRYYREDDQLLAYSRELLAAEAMCHLSTGIISSAATTSTILPNGP